jgi:hypothetical protein
MRTLTSARSLCFVNLAVQFILFLLAIRIVALTTRIVCIWNRNAPFPAASQRRPHTFPSDSVHRRATEKETLEANLVGGVKFPVSLTLLLNLPSMELDAKSDVFRLTFTGFTDECGTGYCCPISNMPNMRCDFTQVILNSKLLGETLL